jgi:hypothetical protein
MKKGDEMTDFWPIPHLNRNVKECCTNRERTKVFPNPLYLRPRKGLKMGRVRILNGLTKTPPKAFK